VNRKIAAHRSNSLNLRITHELINVDMDKVDAGIFSRVLLEDRRNKPARATPHCREINNSKTVSLDLLIVSGCARIHLLVSYLHSVYFINKIVRMHCHVQQLKNLAKNLFNSSLASPPFSNDFSSSEPSFSAFLRMPFPSVPSILCNSSRISFRTPSTEKSTAAFPSKRKGWRAPWACRTENSSNAASCSTLRIAELAGWSHAKGHMILSRSVSPYRQSSRSVSTYIGTFRVSASCMLFSSVANKPSCCLVREYCMLRNPFGMKTMPARSDFDVKFSWHFCIWRCMRPEEGNVIQEELVNECIQLSSILRIKGCSEGDLRVG
jgi:hypothetical protein